jgi:hypothetical protein
MFVVLLLYYLLGVSLLDIYIGNRPGLLDLLIRLNRTSIEPSRFALSNLTVTP